MSRDPYSSRDMVDDDLNRLAQQLSESTHPTDIAKLLAGAVIVLARATADVADAVRKP